jgi:hypothetical protein
VHEYKIPLNKREMRRDRKILNAYVYSKSWFRIIINEQIINKKALKMAQKRKQVKNHIQNLLHFRTI